MDGQGGREEGTRCLSIPVVSSFIKEGDWGECRSQTSHASILSAFLPHLLNSISSLFPSNFIALWKDFVVLCLIDDSAITTIPCCR